MLWRVEVTVKESMPDPAGRSVLDRLHEAGLAHLERVQVSNVYLIEGSLDRPAVQRVAQRLLIDPVLSEFTAAPANEPPVSSGSPGTVVLIFKKPGVMDPVEASALKAIRDLGYAAQGFRHGQKYVLSAGRISEEDLRRAFTRGLANAVVDDVIVGDRTFDRIALGSSYRFERVEVSLLNASIEELQKISDTHSLSLNAAELQIIQNHFRTLKRNPTDVELETLAQTWSEHCKHKTFIGNIRFEGKTIENLLKSTIMKATRELNVPWCLSVFKDNAGVIEFDEEDAICFKVETHNHPSAIEPYGGANTGLGGVIRDILGCGLGARPFANTDVFCVGPPDLPADDQPPGTIPPKKLLQGVVTGVRDYGNRMGIPTVNGAVFADARYVGNPLVYCGTAGIMPKRCVTKQARTGEVIVVVGGRTGRDGIHGATFSSIKLTDQTESLSSGAVQIGNAIMEKRMMDTLLQARDRGLYSAVTDCGAGGLSSAVGEMGADLGAEVDLEKVPLKYEGLSYCEIWISEAQERMVLSVPPDMLKELLSVFAAEDVEATAIGKFTEDRRLRLRYQGHVVADLDMEFLHDGLPRPTKTAAWTPPKVQEPDVPLRKNYGEDLKRILSSWNVCSKEWIIRQYDHEVQGGSVIKSLQGGAGDGPGDAAVVRPKLGSFRGVAIANGMNPRYGDLDPYGMAASAIDEALRNIVAVGGDLTRTAILDNFSWGNPDRPEILGALVRAAQACYDIAKGYGVPFISGKDSLHNEYHAANGTVITIPHSLLISAIGVIEDVRKCVTMDAKRADNLIYIIGMTRRELGGSHFYRVNNLNGPGIPAVDTASGKEIFSAVTRAIRTGWVESCHDCSEGGLAVALAEMAFAGGPAPYGAGQPRTEWYSGGLGIEAQLKEVPRASDVARDDEVLFSESNTRFIVEVAPQNRKSFEATLGPVPAACVGRVTTDARLRLTGLSGHVVVDESLAALKESWQNPMRW